uniref:Uncharacterized protein n=1 Tax=Arundo donax TaxID=35708 RepID=A0A0A9CZT8_ARUDO
MCLPGNLDSDLDGVFCRFSTSFCIWILQNVYSYSLFNSTEPILVTIFTEC